MFKLRRQRFRTLASALAMLGVVLNVWVLTVHVTSVGLTSLRADGTGTLICHRGAFVFVASASPADKSSGTPTPASRKRCPICSGLATLHIGVLSEPALDVGVRGVAIATEAVRDSVRIADRRPRQFLNRGPPIQA